MTVETNVEPTVFVIDDDHEARQSVCALARSMGVSAKDFDSAESFLDFYRGDPGCLVTDFRMRGMNGLELQESLIQRGNQLPVIIVTAYARTPLTVQAIQKGAITMMDKPYDDDSLWQSIRLALSVDQQRRQEHKLKAEAKRRIDSLNDKERSVLELILKGTSNRTMAEVLNVSLRTIENRRRKVFSKLAVDSLAELVAMVLSTRDSQSELTVGNLGEQSLSSAAKYPTPEPPN